MNMKLLKRKDFSLLILGKFISLIGTGMQNFAFSLYVLKITGSGTKFASVLAVGLIPQIILGPIGGVFSDWFDRKKIIVLLDMLSGVLIGSMAFIYIINGRLDLVHIYIATICLSTISILFNPAITSIIPAIMKKEELVDANSINSLTMTIGQFISPLLAGLIYGVLGIFPVLIINSISFFLSSISEMFISIPKRKKKTSSFNLKQFNKDFAEGIKFIKNKSIMLKLIISSFIINFLFNPIGAVVFPFLCKQVLEITDIQYGIFEASILIGSLIAPFLSGVVTKKFEISKIYNFGILIEGVVVGMIGLIAFPRYLDLFPSNLIPYLTLIVIGIIMVAVVVIINISVMTIFQREIPLEMMGRVSSVNMTVCMGAIPLGQIVFGVLLDNIQTYLIIMISAVIFILIGVILIYSMKNAEEEEVLNEKLEVDSL